MYVKITIDLKLCGYFLRNCILFYLSDFLLIFFVILALPLTKKVDALVFLKYVPSYYFHQTLLTRK